MVKLRAVLTCALLFALTSLAFGQAQIGSGQVWGNSTAAQKPGKSEAVTAIFDRAFGNTRGAIFERGASGWGLFNPSATARVPYLSGGAGADPLYGPFTIPSSVTSGGVACFTSTTAMASSIAMTANALMLGGGVGACPTSVASLGATTTVLHGNAGGAPTFNSVSLIADVTGTLPIGNGGTNCAAATGTCLDNITGFSSTGYLKRTGPGNYSFIATIPLSDLGITPTRAGDIIYWNGSSWITLTGNNSGNNFLQENASGVPNWVAASGTGTVLSVTCGPGLSGGTFTTSGTCAINLSQASNILGADVTLSTQNVYQDGPSMAQGGTGTWWVSGQVTVSDTSGAAGFICKLWDLSTVIASGAVTTGGTAFNATMSLSGILTSPAANIRISCADAKATPAGAMKFNASGNSKDSSIYGMRIQ